MTTFLSTLALKRAALAASVLPLVMLPSTQGLSPADAVALEARFDPSLGALRAGSIEAPAPFGADERAELASAQQNSASLAELRAGAAPTDNEWKWLAIGGGAVLLLIFLL